MGAALSLCPGRIGIKDEQNTEFNYAVSETKHPTPTAQPEENEESKHSKASIIQANWKRKKEKEQILERIRVLDANLDKLGKYISIENMKLRVDSRIQEVECKLIDFKGTPEDRDGFDSKLTFRPPFKFNLDNSIYHGQWNSEGLREGYGIFISDDNVKTEGLWRDGKLFKGRIFKDDGSYYEGEINENKANGDGAIYFYNGDVFKGKWIDDLQTGHGSRIFQDGFKYEGEFLNDHFNNQGIFTWPDGSLYEGNFENSTIRARGVFKNLSGEVYDGLWSNNMPNGHGTYNYTGKFKGVVYEGDFKNGKKEGNGKSTFSEENFYEGEWMAGFPHGKGSYNVGKNTHKGIWRFGILVFSDSGNQSKEEISVPNLKENFKDKRNQLHLRDEVDGEIKVETKNGQIGKNYKPNEGNDILKLVSKISKENNSIIDTNY